MQESNATEGAAVVVAMLAALERYQASFDTSIAAWFDRGSCRRAAGDLDELRHLARAVPQLGADMLDLTMRHAQVLQLLLKSMQRAAGATEVQALSRQHRGAVERVKLRCVRLLAVRTSVGEHAPPHPFDSIA